jgi:hypothetical protein
MRTASTVGGSFVSVRDPDPEPANLSALFRHRLNLHRLTVANRDRDCLTRPLGIASFSWYAKMIGASPPRQ